ncbi:MAG: tRNA (cytidine(34)-2'-O)-methyltransferase [Deltaproteobacteria bacterium]|nr:tRNA (cytidine(34)-2'-O)-methyltransferase [Deltaproteobacteria bacterium]
MNRALHVVFVEPEIHWNTGNVGRTCLALGAQLHLVKPLGFSLDDRQVKRAGLDYWPHVKPVVWPDFAHFEEALPQLGEAFFFTTGGQRDLWDVSFPKPTVLVFGRESVGLSPEICARYADRSVSIPMPADGGAAVVRSLNLSTASGIAMYEVVRQWLHGV